MKDLTKRQNEILNFVALFINEKNYAPSVREIAAHFNLSVKGAHDHLKALKSKGWVRMQDKISRSIEIVDKNNNGSKDGVEMISMLGEVAAGRRILSEESYLGTIPIHRSLLKGSRQYFAVKVRGDSMVGAGIVEGDIAIIEKHDTAKNGDIVAAVVDENGYVLKRFYKLNNIIKLKSENPAYHPLICDDIKILGKLVYIFRSYEKKY